MRRFMGFRRMVRHVSTVVLALSLALSLAGCRHTITPIPSGTPVPDADSPIKVVNLEQGWDEKTQLAFWFTSQGSQIVPYAWFLAIEQADNDALFRADANIRRLGYLPARPGPGKWNPDGLPVGMVKAVDRSGDWMGVTCAACHTGQVDYKGVGLRIDGGPTIGDFFSLYADLIASMSATLDDAAKFERFATRVLGPSPPPADREALRTSLAQTRTAAQARYQLNKPSFAPGHARIDAFGNIFNELLVTALNQPGNVEPPDAPVSYPFLWDTPQHDVVQWNGSAPNGPFRIGELARNTGEVVGVFGGLEIARCNRDACEYPSNVDVGSLGKLETWVRSLWSPQWSDKYLEPIDRALAAQGKAHYAQYCVECHAIIDRTNPRRTVTAIMRDVGTDPGMATAAATRTATTGPLDGRIKTAIPLTRFGATDSADGLLANGVIGILLGKFDAAVRALYDEFQTTEVRGRTPALATPASVGPKLSEQEIRDALHRHALVRQQLRETRLAALSAAAGAGANAIYKARPLNGIWATAPYLHNGSVPTLWALLQEPDQRVKVFYVGSREFDPKNVGFQSAAGPYKFDTSLRGNSNAGHTAGTKELTETQKRALLEYLKTL